MAPATGKLQLKGMRQLPLVRLSKFGAIGALCFGVQLGIMLLLIRAGGLTEVVANGIGFWSSAQVNFLLSRTFTWGESERRGSVITEWLAYNVVTGLSLGVNTGAFWLARQVLLVEWAALAAVGVTAVVTFVMHHFGTFRKRSARAPDAYEVKQLAAAGVAFFMPGKNESENIPGAVEDVSEVLNDIGVPHTIIVVDDGSTDETPEVVRTLQQRYPTLKAVRHAQNRGYGAALRTGFTEAYATGHGLIAFFDADRQFRAGSLRVLLSKMVETEADVVVGNRAHRADSLKRKLMGAGWHWLSRLTLGFQIRDVDCGFKLFRREVFDAILPYLDAEHAAISPQLMALLTQAGFRVAEADVAHLPRQRGEQTGSNLAVVTRSLEELVRIRKSADAFVAQGNLRTKTRGGWWRQLLPVIWIVSMMVVMMRTMEARRSLPKQPTSLPGGLEQKMAVSRRDGREAKNHRAEGWWRRRDPMTMRVGLMAAVLSVAAWVYFYLRGATLAYNDALSHLMIARRLTNSPTPGLAQLGGVWLPLPHILTAPLVWWDALYYSGIGGSLVSMVAYVVAGILLYKIGWQLTRRRAGGIATAAVFLLNPNTLYMQSTPMTELLLLVCMAGSIYGLLRWAQTDQYPYLLGAAAAAFLATLTRYEGWVLLGALVMAMVYIGVRKRFGWAKLEGTLTAFLTLAAAGVAGWLAWNWLLFGDWLAFQRGEYAKPSLWVGSGEPSIGHLDVALKTYGYAVLHNLTWPIAVMAVVGLVAYVWRTRLSAEGVAPLALLAFFPFFVVALYKGQRPLHVAEIQGALYNVRFGLVMLLPAAVFCGYLVALAGRVRLSWIRGMTATALVVLTVLSAGWTMASNRTVTMNEPLAERSNAWSQRALTASAWWRRHYQGGRVLMETFGNELVVFMAEIPSGEHVYEGSYRKWEPALVDPAGNNIEWIYMRRTPGSEDRVYRQLHGSDQLQAYTEVFADNDRLIYKRSRDAGPARPVEKPVVLPLTQPVQRPVAENKAITAATVKCGALVVRRLPTSTSQKLSRLPAGTRAEFEQVVTGNDPYTDGRNRWLKLPRGYIWSGCTDYAGS